MFIAQIYALTDAKKYEEAIEQCEKVIAKQPQFLHAYYRKTIQCVVNALQFNPKFCIAYFQKGYMRLQELEKQLYNKKQPLKCNYLL
ncbi:unnamed protein product [Paramecium pentaurelia]|uniref:Tetratricopeptide repeat protein n=1 Tax=Paramecium pentaurelia TaxID=43138 RepID=A0A8S1XUX2_9CILI|nr:unnamed protein product [Paramecium pentaurelia]